MKILLHIGQGKAGSTAIQESLDASRDQLSQNGYLYPNTLFIRGRHHWLSVLLLKDPTRSPSVVQRMGFDVSVARKNAWLEWENLQEQIRTTRPRTLLLSSETLFRTLSDMEVRRARKLWHRLSEEIRVLAYVRSPVARYLSLVQQQLKSINKIVEPEPGRILKILSSYEEIFDRHVEARVFDRSKLRNGDVVDDFTEWAEVSGPPGMVTAVSSNESLSAEAMAVLQSLTPEKFAVNAEELKAKRHIVRAVSIADRKLENPTKPKLNVELAEYITRRSTELPELEAKYGLRFDDIDYSLIGKSGHMENIRIDDIRQLCPVDQSRKEELFGLASDIIKKKKQVVLKSTQN